MVEVGSTVVYCCFSLHCLENLVSQCYQGQHTGCTLCYTFSRQALGTHTHIPTPKYTQMILLTCVTSVQRNWGWKTIYSLEQINHFRTSLGKFGMSHGSNTQEKSLSFECLLLFSEQSLLTEKCMLLTVKAFSSFASKPWRCFLPHQRKLRKAYMWPVWLCTLKSVCQFVANLTFCLIKML